MGMDEAISYALGTIDPALLSNPIASIDSAPKLEQNVNE